MLINTSVTKHKSATYAHFPVRSFAFPIVELGSPSRFAFPRGGNCSAALTSPSCPPRILLEESEALRKCCLITRCCSSAAVFEYELLRNVRITPCSICIRSPNLTNLIVDEALAPWVLRRGPTLPHPIHQSSLFSLLNSTCLLYSLLTLSGTCLFYNSSISSKSDLV